MINFFDKIEKYFNYDNSETELKPNSELECNIVNSSNFSNILDENDVFTFGKYSGLKISDVIKINPEYIIWCDINIDYIKFKPNVIKNAESNIIIKFRYKLLIQKKKKEMYFEKLYNNDTDIEIDTDIDIHEFH